MTIDFRASQIQVRQLIASGALDGSNKDQLLIYPKSAATNNEGGIGFDTSPLSGSDVFVYVSGSSNSKGGSENSVWVFGGDTHTSGVNHSDRISSFMSTVEGEAVTPGGINYSTIINSYESRISGSTLSSIVAGYGTENINAIASFVASSLYSGLLETQFSSVISSQLTSITGSQLSQIVASQQSSIDTSGPASFNSVISSLQCGIAGSFPVGVVIAGSKQSSINTTNHFSSILSSDNSEMANSTNSSILASSECLISASDGYVVNAGRNNTILGSYGSTIRSSAILGESEQSGIISSVSGGIVSSDSSFCAASSFSNILISTNSIVGSSFQSIAGAAAFSTMMSTYGSTIANGSRNIITATSGSTIDYSTDSSIAGGSLHKISASNNSSIVGGSTNTMVSSSNGLILGGLGNNNNLSTGSIIFGGFSNVIHGGNWSFIMGQTLGITTPTTIKMGGDTYSTNIYGPTTFTNKGSGIRGGLHTHTPAAFYHNILAESGSYGSGVAGEFIGSHQKLKLDGTPAFLAGPNITIVTNSLGQIEISGSGGGGGSTPGSIGIAVSPSVTGSSNVDAVSYNANDITFQHVGNIITYAGTVDVIPSSAGMSSIIFDMSSILTPLPDQQTAGVAAIIKLSGSNLTTSTAFAGINPSAIGQEMLITFDALGALPHKIGFSVVGYTSSSVGSGGSGLGTSGPTRTNVGSYLLTTAEEALPQTAGAGYYKASEHDSMNYVFRAILSTTTGSNSAYVKLLNANTGNFVEIGGPGIDYLSTNSTSASLVESVNLFGAANFTSDAVYQVMVYGSGSAPTTVHYNSEIVFL